MSKHEWKPGDVALWDIDGQAEILFFCHTGPRFDEPKWQTADSGEGWPSDEHLRRAVVIDPEDVEHVERLTAAIADTSATHQPWSERGSANRARSIAGVRDALRSLTRPPKPAEPKAIGSRVETEGGIRYTRFSDSESHAQGDWINEDGVIVQWHEIPAAHIVSEGVTA